MFMARNQDGDSCHDGGGDTGGDGEGCSEGGAAGSAAPQLTATSDIAASPEKELPRVYSKANDGE